MSNDISHYVCVWTKMTVCSVIFFVRFAWVLLVGFRSLGPLDGRLLHSAQYKTFGDITDAEFIAEALYPRAKLSAAELRIML